MARKSIQFKIHGATADVVGKTHGLTRKEWSALSREIAGIVGRLNRERDRTPYRDVPHRQGLSQLGAVLASARAKAGLFDDVVILGIGGSALGLTALKTALRTPYWNSLPREKRQGLPRVWVMDNVDPDEFATMLDLIDPKRTLVNVISKSGSTAETVSQFLLVMELLESCVGKRNLRRHVVVTTDARAGLLRPLVNEMGLESFIVPDGVGGRFSVMTPVGTFPAAMIGIDVRALHAGTRAMDKRCTAGRLDDNPAAAGAAVQIGLYRKGKTMSVMMPYAAALRDVADWYRQLWAESLGKTTAGGEQVGPTPIKALGVTDQHSQVQLYRDGPNDKVFTILSVDRFGCTLPLPQAPAGLGGADYLEGRTMKDLLKAEERATIWALAAVSKRPTTQIVLPRADAWNVGGLLYMLMVETSIAGAMLGINTYDQPGVEAGKEAARALMGVHGDISSPTAKGLPAEAASYEGLRRLIDDADV